MLVFYCQLQSVGAPGSTHLVPQWPLRHRHLKDEHRIRTQDPEESSLFDHYPAV